MGRMQRTTHERQTTMKIGTTNQTFVTMTAQFAQLKVIRMGLAVAEVGSTAQRTISEYRGLGSNVSNTMAQFDGNTSAELVLPCNLEEVKTMRRAVGKLLDSTFPMNGYDQELAAWLYARLQAEVERCNALLATGQATYWDDHRTLCQKTLHVSI